tara:strand:+ start:1824 stop:2036 length:213 start_codon:yes stop_codon:yes gene_type:complete
MLTVVLDNKVEDYLKENKEKKLSLRRIMKDLKIKRRKAIWLIHQSTKIESVKPLDVGSRKRFLHVYKYRQ